MAGMQLAGKKLGREASGREVKGCRSGWDGGGGGWIDVCGG
jgi:hypothetical protein